MEQVGLVVNLYCTEEETVAKQGPDLVLTTPHNLFSFPSNMLLPGKGLFPQVYGEPAKSHHYRAFYPKSTK